MLNTRVVTKVSFSAKSARLVRLGSVSVLFFVAVAALLINVVASISLSTSTAYTQNFDGIGTSATATLPADFRADKPSTVRTVGTFAAAGTTTSLVGGANLSSSASNGIYNFGSGTTTTGPDRAVGFLSSGTATQSGNLYAQLANNTGGNLSGVQISYDVEKYRNGSNPNGFRIQMFYSADGSTWTSAGADFLTSFAADANNNGFATAPGATVSVTNKTLSVTVANGGNLYLAWNYSVTATSTTTNAQALAIDNISILGIAGAGPTNPSGVGAANPSSVPAGSQTLLTVTVTPGSNPTSTGLGVTADLSSIGGAASQQFFDDATHGDITAGDNIFSFQATVAANTTGGAKSLPVTITDAQARTGTTSINLTVLVPTPPSGVGAANPNPVQAGNSSLLTVTVTPGSNPTSTGLSVTGDLSSIGGSSSQQFYDDGTHGDVTAGNNVFSFNATVSNSTTVGTKSLPITITDAQSRTGNTAISLDVQSAPPVPGSVVISQLYGGGGNSGATFKNDFVEIFNRSSNTVSLTGWSVQYSSAAGNFGGSTSKTTLSGSLAPGQYYLVQLAAGAGGTDNLPTPDAVGTTNMSATAGKVALVSNNAFLSGSCPVGTSIIDFIGYGAANCFEGAGPAPGLDNLSADFRTHLGCKDTDSNGGNFTSGPPNPRNTSSPVNICPTGDFPPEIFGTSPAANEAHVPLDANITINFDEPVNVTGPWFQISCTSTGLHTATVSGGPISFTLNPDSDFTFNEPCTVTVFASQVTDQDLDDPPDNMAADYVFSFNSEFFRDPAEHMVMGNPTNAVADANMTTNFLMMKIQYALSFNNDRGIPNWTSWHLDSTWRGSAPRQDDFRNDTTLPPNFHQVQGTDYSGSGFDRGHMCPSADRTSTIADNSATFLMTNMVPQAPDNNQGPWAAFENYLRTFLPGNEIYILSGGTGTGGVGSNGSANTIAGGFVTVPATTWKVALILPVGDNDISRVDNNTRTIAVIMPNTNGIRSDQWQKYLATVDQAEALSGYDFYSNVPTPIQDVIEARLDAENDTAPTTSDQTKTTAEDQSVSVTLSASDFNVNNVFTYTVVDPPLHGMVSGSGANLTYSPDPHYFGADHFTYKANDGALDSNVSTVNITVTEVNNDPVAVSDSKQTAEDSALNFPATDLTSNDSPGPNESGQTLTVDSIISTPNTHGSIVLSNGQITYTPEADYNGPASFDYHLCDDGTTNGVADPKCTIGTVNITVTEVNDNPSASSDNKTTAEDSPLTFPASDLTANDSAGPANESSQTLTVSSVMPTANTHGTVSLSNGQIVYAPAADYNGPASFEYEVCDNGTTNGTLDSKCATATVNLTVTEVNDAPLANTDSKQTTEDGSLTFPAADLAANDSAGPADESGQSLTITGVSPTADTHGSVVLQSGQVVYTPDANYNGPASFNYQVCDDGTTNGAPDPKCATGTVNVTVTEVNDDPVAANDAKSTSEDGSLSFPASDLTANDSTGPVNESGQTLTVSSVTSTANTHGTVSLSSGQIVYTPAADYNGPASFNYQVCDDGTTNGSPDSKCATGTVTVTIGEVNDNPVANADSKNTNEDTSLSFPASDLTANDSAGPANESGQTLTVSSVTPTANTHGTVSLNSGTVSYQPAANYNGPASFAYQVCDNGTTNGSPDPKCSTGTVNVTVNSVNDPPALTGVPANASVPYDTQLTFTAQAMDVDVPAQTLVFSLIGAPAGASIGPSTGVFTWTPTAAQAGAAYTFSVAVSDGEASVSSSITVTVNLQALTSLGPAQVWVGLKNSDDVGTKFDLKAEVFKNGDPNPIGSGVLPDAPGGSSGFNNAILDTIILSQTGSTGFRTGDILSIKLSVRVAASSGHNSGTARLWFNDNAANSHFDATIGNVARSYFLRTSSALTTFAGSGPRSSIDVSVSRSGGNPFKPFGTWMITY